MTEQDKQALIKHFCFRDCGDAAEGCTIMPCHEIELIQEFPTTDTDSDMISRKAAIDALKRQAETMSEWSKRYAEQRKGVLTAVNIVEDLPPAQLAPSQVAKDISRIVENEQDMRVIAQPERIKGHWIPVGGALYQCDQCGVVSLKRKFCSECGADMREVTT